MSTIALWRMIQRQNFTNWQELLAYLEIPESLISEILPNPRFTLNLPRRLAEKIAKGTLDDPILRQFLPSIKELQTSSEYSEDPVADELFRPAPKLLHKYHGRALLLCISACAMHCRYCFRQHFEYETGDKLFQKELEAIAADSSLSEILLSGGDPLSLSNADLKQLIESLANIAHVKRIRFHTRFPIGIPERIDDELLSILTNTQLQVIFVIHCNHPKELDDAVISALKQLQRLAIPVLCQSVLLRGVNDDLDTLFDLYENIINAGILPYYLHQLDKVQGGMHFEVPIEKGKFLMQQLSARLPGYAVPRYVQEIPHQRAKLPIY